MHISLFALSGILIALSSGVMAGVMLALGRSRLHLLWGIFCISVFIWGFGAFLIGTTTDPELAELWWRLTHIGVAFIPALFLHFVYTFLDLKRTYTLIALYVIAAVFSVLALSTDVLIADMRFVFDQFYYDSPPGILYPLFTTYFFGLTIFSHYVLYIHYRLGSSKNAAEVLDRTRVKYFFLGMMISFAGGSMSFLPVYGIDIYPVTNFAVILYPIIIGYAILKHQLFDIRVATAQGLVFLLWIFVGVRLALSSNAEEVALNGFLFVAVVILGIFLVISVNKEIKSREKLEEKERDLEIANQQQESLLHFISHEVKGYLAKNEAAFAAIKDGDFGAITPELQSMSSLALTDTRKGVATVMDILDASNLKSGAVSYNKKQFDIAQALDETVQGLQSAANEKGITLTCTKPAEALIVNGDIEKIREHVLRNVIDNSIKYTPYGSVNVSAEKTDGKIRITVSDTGVGITPEDMKKLFTAGGHGAESVRINVHSTGYGLYIAKSIVEAHGGKIWAESEGKDKGSRFIIDLPSQ